MTAVVALQSAPAVLRLATILAVLDIGASVGHAQEIAGSFDQLRVLVKPGDTVTVTDSSGRDTKGKIAELSATTLSLLVDGKRRDLPASEVTTIRQRRPDSLANGAAWGFGIGAALGLATGLAVTSEYDEEGGEIVAFATLIYGGIGAGVGVGVDALISSRQVIYARTSSRSVRVAPLLNRRQRAVLVTFAF